MADKKDEKPEESKHDDAKKTDETGAEGEATTEGEGKKGGKFSLKNMPKKKLIMLIAAVVLVLGAATGGIMFMKHKKAVEHEQEEQKKVEEESSEHGDVAKTAQTAPADVFLDLDEFLVNLSTNSKTPSFLKLKVALLLEKQEDSHIVTEKMPLVRDNFQVYLREITADDLKGSSGVMRLREELLLRINKVVEPVKVKDILFKEILVQ